MAAAGSICFSRPRFTHHLESRDEILKRAAAVFFAMTEGRLRVTLCRVFPCADAAEAHRLLQSRQTMGKILLSLE